MLHRGFREIRLIQDNPKESIFSKKWKEENNRPDGSQLVQMLIPECTERDTEVAATIIQWLGSSVGMCFLSNIIRESSEIKQWLKFESLTK